MTSWFSTLVGVVGFRSVRTGGVTTIRPARVPWGATLSSLITSTDPSSSHQQRQQHQQQQQQKHQHHHQQQQREQKQQYRRFSLMSFPDYPQVSLRRQCWSERDGVGVGVGVDRKWIHDLRGGDGRAFEKSLGEGDHIVDKENTPKKTSKNKNKRQKQRTEVIQPKQQLSSHTYPISVCSIQGFRSYMEDELFVSLDGDFAAVFDGHGGSAVSRYLRKNLYANVQAVLPILTPVTTSVASTRHQEEELWTTTGSAAEFTTTNHSRTETELHRVVTPTAPTWQDYQTALEAALEKVDREVQRISHWSYQGSTAVVIWIHEDRRPINDPDEQRITTESPAADPSVDKVENDTTNPSGQRTIIAANVGDSRAVLCRNNTAWELTRDHKPNDPLEKSRIEQLGGKVVWCGEIDRDGNPILEQGIYRVNGNLALSRAIGDRSERPHVTAAPEIVAIPVQDDDEFIILATDGLWDVLESSEAVDLVQRLVQQGLAKDQVATWLVDESMRRGTYDNVTVVIIWLDRHPTSKLSPHEKCEST